MSAYCDNREKSFEGIVRHRASIHPDRAFLYDGVEVFTWLDIEKISQIMAYDLSEAGVGPDTHAGLMSENSADMICAFFAIQKLGAVAVLINPGFTEPEIVSISEIGGVAHLCVGSTSSTDHFMPLSKRLTKADSGIRYCYDVNRRVDFR